MNPSTLIKVLQDASAFSNHGVTFIEQGGHEEFLSYKELYRHAIKGAHFLQESGLKPKDELIFQLEDNRTFIILFWSCILAGIVPVPLSIGKNDDQKAKLFNVWQVLENPYLACKADHLEKIASYGVATGQGQLYARIKGKTIAPDDLEASHEEGEIHEPAPSDLAFIQFSSGSTGSPKGVMLTHENLISNVAAIGNAAGYASSDSTISWMPLTHDMGLIGFHINPIYNQMNQYLMPTSVFVRNPTIWLSKTTEHQVTVICSPNFGYKYLLKYYDESKDYAWNLSKVRIIYNGAEPISEKLGLQFLDTLAKYGLEKKAMCPVYGLAEASLAVSISDLQAEIKSIPLDRTQLNVGDQVKAASHGNALSFVNVGRAIDDVSISITNAVGNEVPDETIGHVKIKGKNVTAGYYNNPEATNKAIGTDGWLDTGDLGFMKAKELFITGRAKDVFFINGQNFYPHDLERIAEIVDGIDLNKVIIAGASVGESAVEEVIAFVYQRGDIRSFLPTIQALKAQVNLQTGIDLAQVIPVKDIPKTTSGKLQRFKLVEKYKAGDFNQVIEEVLKAQRTAEGADAVKAQPQNDTEQQLLDIWKELFSDPNISVTDRFFEIGGNSLKAAEFGMMVLKQFEVDLPLAAMYDHQSVRDIASLISSLSKTEYKAIAKVPKGDKHPVSTLQRRLYYFQETQPNSTAYNVPVAFETDADLDVDMLQNCFEQLSRRYDVLRSSFHQQGQELVMKVHESVVFEINIAETDAYESFIKPFDLRKPGLFSISLLKNEAGKSVLFLDFHHIIMDGVSISFLVDELLELYQGRSLKSQSAQYADFVPWSEVLWQTDAYQAHKQYWLEQLAGELPLLDMPLKQSRPRQFDHSGEKISFKISKVKSAKLRELSKKLDCSMHVLMFTAYNLLLHKYTGQKELVIGIPVTVRNHPDVSRSMGMFVNNLAIRVQIEPNESIQSLVEKITNTVNEALAQDYPFDLLMKELGTQRDMSRNPLFDTMFLYQNMDLPTADGDALQLTPVPVNPKTAKFDISQEVFDNGSGPLTYGFEYATKLFGTGEINALASHFDTVLDRILLKPGSRIADISLLSVEEYQNQVFDFNDTAKDYSGQSVLDLISNQVKENPEAKAIKWEGESISYIELAGKSDAVAKLLLDKGLKRGDIVSLYMNRTPELIIGILGTMKADGVYLPIDTDLPAQRLKYLLSHSQCQWVLSKEEYPETLKEAAMADCQIMPLDWKKLDTLQLKHDSAIDSNQLAYLLYTSGTTGKPKGVKVTHKALHNYISWAAEQYVGSEGGSFPLFTSISFDLTVTSLFTPLATGHSIVIYDETEQHQEHGVIRALRDNEVDVMKLTPSHLRLLRDIDLSKNDELRLQKMILGGEAFDATLAREIQDQFGGKLTLFNEYGPTEATVGCMLHVYEPEEVATTVPIGRPAANTQLYLLDDQLQLVPTGVTGEIYIAGAGLAAGYWVDEELTQKKFIPNPFASDELMYKTGDQARRRADGSLEYLGRIDEQLKINGYRIEPEEIIYHLREYAGIADAVVLAKTLNGRMSLCAYLLTNGESEALDQVALKAYLAERLPFYMIPGSLMTLDAYPLTSNGKIDLRKLADITVAKEVRPSQLPANELEQTLAHIWQEILDTEDISVDDNYFELGGDSIKAVQIVARMHEKGLSAQVKDILTYHSIAQLLASGKLSENKSVAEQGAISGSKAMSPIESWFFGHQFAKPSYYNQSVLLDINQPLDLGLLQKAFEVLVNHHDGLRLNYNAADHSLFFKKQHLTEEFIVQEIPIKQDFIGQMVTLKSGFDISQSLLLKAAVFTRNGKQKYLFITAHHLVTDGLSWRILLHDLSAVYEDLVNGAEPSLPQKTESLLQWQKELDHWQPGNDFVNEQYWEQLANTRFELPLEAEPTQWSVADMKQHVVSIDKDQTDYLLKEAHKPYRTDVFTLLNVALAWALREWTGLNEFIVEHENHGRHLDDCDVSRTLGWFTAMYPVKLALVGDDPKEQIKAIKEQIKKVPDHGLGFGLSQSDIAQKRSEIRFNYLGEFSLDDNMNWSYSGLYTGPETHQDNHMTTKLDLNAMVMNGQFSLDITYHSEAFQDQTVQDFGTQFLNQLNQLLVQIRAEHDVHFTPSDFEAELDQEELDELFT